jgi:hypothetical protein
MLYNQGMEKRYSPLSYYAQEAVAEVIEKTYYRRVIRHMLKKPIPDTHFEPDRLYRDRWGFDEWERPREFTLTQRDKINGHEICLHLFPIMDEQIRRRRVHFHFQVDATRAMMRAIRLKIEAVMDSEPEWGRRYNLDFGRFRPEHREGMEHLRGVYRQGLGWIRLKPWQVDNEIRRWLGAEEK